METSANISVDVNKLRYLIKALPKATNPPPSVDFSDFAARNFEKAASLTQEAKRSSKRRHSKWVYNEVQRNSINFGVSAQEMILFHNQKKRESSVLGGRAPESIQKDPEHKNDQSVIGKQETLNNNRESCNPEGNYNQSEFQSSPPKSPVPNHNIAQFPKGLQQKSQASASTPTTPTTPTIPQTPVRPTRNPPELGLDRSPNITIYSDIKAPPSQSAGSSPVMEAHPLKRQTSATKTHNGLNDNSSAISISSSLRKLRRKSSLSNLSGHGSSASKDEFKYKLSSSTLQRQNSQKSSRSSFSRPSSRYIPSQRECHSIEDTLLADKDFNDFSIPKRSSRILARDNQFDFEKPLSRAPSESSLSNNSLALNDISTSNNGSPRFLNNTRFDNPISPIKLRQRHSVADVQRSVSLNTSPLSPGGKSMRSMSTNETFGSSPTKYSPRLSWRTSMSDLKGSPIEKIAEHEISSFHSPNSVRNSWIGK